MMEKPADLRQKIETLEGQNQELQLRLEEAEATLHAITTGEVDALVVYREQGETIYTLQGADHAYRVMVESIHEGAANIAENGTILYCNKFLAELLKTPLENVLGSSIYQYILPEEQATFTNISRKGLESFGKSEFQLVCAQGATVPVLITASTTQVDRKRIICLVVTDLTEQKQAVERERELQTRLIEQREEERVRIARNLHDGPLQDVIGLSFAIESIMATNGEASENHTLHSVRESILKLAGELRNVCNELRPPNAIRFGLAKAIQYFSEEFQAKNPTLAIHLHLTPDQQMIPIEIRGVLFRVFQECMNNVMRHASASNVDVHLNLSQNIVQLEVVDDGVGFHAQPDWIELARQGHLGLVGMKERIESVGGRLFIASKIGSGTSIKAEAPFDVTEAS